MNRQQRRQYERDMRKALVNRKHVPNRDDEGNAVLGSHSPIPAGIKADICRVVRSIEFTGLPGGDCTLRVGIAYTVLAVLGFRPQIAVGSVLFRAGPDEMRDVVAFSGPGNAGCMYEGQFVGHIWLEWNGELLDFTPGDWPRINHQTADVSETGRVLGAIQWQARPPTFVWASRELFGWQAKGTPKLGELWYGPWSGPKPEDDLMASLFEQAKPLFPMLKETLQRSTLPERCGAMWADIGGKPEYV